LTRKACSEEASGNFDRARRESCFVTKMPQMLDKPLLFVDIDGVVSLWGFDSDSRPAGSFHNVDGIIHFLSSDAGIHLLALAAEFDLVWCSGWEEKADEHLPHALDLPRGLPFLSFARNPGRGHAHWKLAAIEQHAGPQRPLAWIDDAHDEPCRAWAAARQAPTLLVTTAPAVGLAASHVDELRVWAGRVARGG
jgi:hypothetical protein